MNFCQNDHSNGLVKFEIDSHSILEYLNNKVDLHININGYLCFTCTQNWNDENLHRVLVVKKQIFQIQILNEINF